MTKELVSIVIVNHNGKKWLRDCFESLLQQTYNNFEIIFIDNASTDDSLNFIKIYYPEARVIINRTNIGFGEANNVGVKQAKGEIIFFLNNDTKLTKDTLEKLIIYKKKHSLNILGPKILDYNGKDIYLGKKLSIDLTGYVGYGEKSFHVDGCALMINKKDFLTLGGFDEKYFMYSEEIDLCWRAHLLDMKVGVCNEVSIQHAAGGTAGSTLYRKNKRHFTPLFRRYEVEKNNLRNVLKNYRAKSLIWVLPLIFSQSLVEIFFYLFTGNFSAATTILKAHLWNVVNLGDTISKRRTIQRMRKIDDKEVFKMMSNGLNKYSALITIGIPKFN